MSSVPSNERIETDDVFSYEEEQTIPAGRKLLSHIAHNPFLPIGMFGTLGVVLAGVINIKDAEYTTKMMRWRVFGQYGTVAALLVGAPVWALITGQGWKGFGPGKSGQ